MRAPSRGKILLWTCDVVSPCGRYKTGVLSRTVGRRLRRGRGCQPGQQFHKLLTAFRDNAHISFDLMRVSYSFTSKKKAQPANVRAKKVM